MLENALQKFLLKDIVIFNSVKKIKAGRVILFTVRDHYIYFTLLYNNTNKKFELPRPFKFTEFKNHLILDYTLDTLSANNEKKLESLKSLTEEYCVTTNRYFNNIVTLSAIG
tara:strand:+ start:103 stop:438 length:336 start_codon:yes stop_codon:yes gene_type:complete